ncbi:MAG: hypothetical protein JEY99_03335 [Spirochaetales bacterium]|nr:hypothetical protein [Spirochaetales bacterium]
MRSKTRIFSSLLFLLLLSTPVALLSAQPLSSADSIWDSAVNFYQSGTIWNPGHMSMESHELDRRGNIKERWETEYIRPPGGSDGDWELIRALKDGRQATEREIKKHEEGEMDNENGPPDNYFDGVNVLPLAPSERENVIPVKTGRTSFFQGSRFSVYTFTHTYQSGAETAGEILVDNEGFPVKLDYEFTNLPFYMKEMKCNFTFTRKEEYAVLETMTMTGHISAIVFNMRFFNKMVFSDFFLTET